MRAEITRILRERTKEAAAQLCGWLRPTGGIPEDGTFASRAAYIDYPGTEKQIRLRIEYHPEGENASERRLEVGAVWKDTDQAVTYYATMGSNQELIDFLSDEECIDSCVQSFEELTDLLEQKYRAPVKEKPKAKEEVPTDAASEDREKKKPSVGRSNKGLTATLLALLLVAGAVGAVLLSGGDAVPGQEVPPVSVQPGDVSEPAASAEPEPSESTSIPSWEDHVLMADPAPAFQLENIPVFGSQFTREEIGSITFLDSLEDLHGTSWDVSQAQDGSVMLWIEDNGKGYYDMFIGAEGGVCAPANCEDLFRGYINAEYIRFNGAFHTEYVTNMGYLFYDCRNLTELDLSGIDTSDVTYMYYMFGSCAELTALNVSGFDTSRVTNMYGMFVNCQSLTALDISGFDVSNVENMSYMFSGCKGLEELEIFSFEGSNLSDVTKMFYGMEEDFVIHQDGLPLIKWDEGHDWRATEDRETPKFNGVG